jgi:selenocysteine lyase/cysteine desulfurase
VLIPHEGTPALAQVREAGGLFLADCSQSAGRVPLPDADMIVVSAHKLGGPIGIGALLVRDFAMLEPVRRARARLPPGEPRTCPARSASPRRSRPAGSSAGRPQYPDRYDFKDLLDRNGEVLRFGAQCSHVLAVAAERISAVALVIKLDAMGFAISAGSACSSGTLKQSRALAAFGVEPELAARTVRVSIGWNTTLSELEAFADAWQEGSRRRMIYLDYQATTPLAPEAREAMLRWLDGPGGTGFGNPHSPHRLGRQAEAAVEVARERVAACFRPVAAWCSPAARPRRSTSRCAAASRAGRGGRWRSGRSSIRRCSTPRSTCRRHRRSCRSTATGWSIRRCGCPRASGSSR